MRERERERERVQLLVDIESCFGFWAACALQPAGYWLVHMCSRLCYWQLSSTRERVTKMTARRGRGKTARDPEIAISALPVSFVRIFGWDMCSRFWKTHAACMKDRQPGPFCNRATLESGESEKSADALSIGFLIRIHSFALVAAIAERTPPSVSSVDRRDFQEPL